MSNWTAHPQAGPNGPGDTIEGMCRILRLYFGRPAVRVSPYLAEDAAVLWSEPITGERRILVGPGSADRVHRIERALDAVFGPPADGGISEDEPFSVHLTLDNSDGRFYPDEPRRVDTTTDSEPS